jgi:hypothetical protein
MSESEPIDVVTTVGSLDPVVVLLREFLHRAGAVRALAIVDLPGDPALVDCVQLQPIEVTVGDRSVVLPHTVELDAPALPVPHVTQLPPFEVKAQEGEVASPLGGLEHYARAVSALATAVPGARSIAMATWSTSDPEAPLSITARGGEPFIVSLGEEQWELDQ